MPDFFTLIGGFVVAALALRLIEAIADIRMDEAARTFFAFCLAFVFIVTTAFIFVQNPNEERITDRELIILAEVHGADGNTERQKITLERLRRRNLNDAEYVDAIEAKIREITETEIFFIEGAISRTLE